MNKSDCLSEQDLILHYYGELPADDEQVHHLSDCQHCAERLTSLGQDLDKFLWLSHEPDETAGTRMAARVSERLATRRAIWLPALGATAVAALALVITITTLSPNDQRRQTEQPTVPALATLSLDEDMPDIDFLEDLELLQELELLSQVEGV